jgi:histidinol-phosphate aminotransferase
MFKINNLLRENIKNLVPYATARDEFSGVANIFLDANENSFAGRYSRYPDPLQRKVKEKLSQVKGVPTQNIFLGNGSDECIDVLLRCCCEPGKDNIIIVPPTYGMYEVSASINNVLIKKIPLLPNFQLNMPAIEAAIDDCTKIIFLCSPNNPTGNSLDRQAVDILLNNYFGLVVIDEAYINFSTFKSYALSLADYPQLVVLQTLSKAWGLAGLRVGMAFASAEIISVMNKVKAPYNINQAAQELVLNALEEVDLVNVTIQQIVKERKWLEAQLPLLPIVETIYPSDANFLLVKVKNATAVYTHLLENGIVVRDRSKVLLCNDCLRITVGTENENRELVKVLAAAG